jgi:hypothetical protein
VAELKKASRIGDFLCRRLWVVQSAPRDLERQEDDPDIELTQNGETGYRIQRQ